MARLVVNLEAIRHNARLIAGLCAEHGVGLAAVTKGVLGDPVVIGEVVAAGVTALADSRLANLRRMREVFTARWPAERGDRGRKLEYHLIRMCAPAEAAEVVALADVSYHTELETVRALSTAAAGLSAGVGGSTGGRKEPHRVVLMVEVGDRREGIMPEDVLETARAVLGLHGVALCGLAMNVGCVGGVLPSPANTGLLAELAADVEARLGWRLELVSGGSSTALPLLWQGRLPRGVNHLRVGSAIWLGDYDTWSEPVPGARHDGFNLVAPVIEVKWKPSLPWGEIGRDLLGRRPVFEDKGPMLRAILALGRQDTYVEGIEPRAPGWRVIGASGDHLIVDVTAAGQPPAIGDEMGFRLSYAALLYAMQSPVVDKRYVRVTA